MAKLVLNIEEDYDFGLIGISAHDKDYRISWAINNILELELSKQESLEIIRKKSEPSYFSLFTFYKEDDYREYAVITNLSENKTLAVNKDTLFSFEQVDSTSQSENDFIIPELKNIDFFLIIRGEITANELNELIKKIKKLEMVLTAKAFDARKLKSKKNLIF